MAERRLTLVERARIAGAAALQRIAANVAPQTRVTRPRPPSPFEDWEYDDIDSSIADALDDQTIDTSTKTTVTPAPGDSPFVNPRAQQDPIAVNRAFYEGNHWMNGAGWIGPHPALGDAAYSDGMNEIARAFTSWNVVREVSDRHALGVAGKPWQWGFVPRRDLDKDEKPTDAEQTLIDEATALVRRWLESRKAETLIRDAVVTLLLAERASLRAYVPAGLMEEDGNGTTTVAAESIEEALGLVWLDHAKPEDSAVVTDSDTKLEAGVWLFDVECDVDESGETKLVPMGGLVFVDEQGATVIRHTPDDDDQNARVAGLALVESSIDIGGRLTMFEMRRTALITPQVQQQQRALNLALSMIPRNVVTGGFLERIILEAMMPGEPELDEEGRKTGRWIERPLFVGAGTTTFLQATEHEDDEGKVNVGRPSVVYREPVKPDASISASAQHYQAILNEVSQLHVLMSGDATTSALSRVTARMDYLNTLLRTKPEVEGALRFILETPLAMAETIAGQPGRYTSQLRAQAQCKLDTGPVTPEERAAIEASIGRTISQETAMVLVGVDDVAAELARINGNQLARANLGKAVGDALQSLALGGASLEGGARFIGIEGDELDALLTPETFSTGPVPPTGAQNGVPPNGAQNGTQNGVPPTNGARPTPDNGNGNNGPTNRAVRGNGSNGSNGTNAATGTSRGANGGKNGRGAAPARNASSSGSTSGGSNG